MKTEHSEVRWGVVGAGDVVERKSGMPLKTVPGSTWRALTRRNPVEAKRVAERFEVPLVCRNIEELLADRMINAVYIATPPSTHAELAVKALESGKDVYLEKPMAMNFREAELVAEAALRNRRKLVIAHYRRALPAFMKVGELIGSGALGKVLFGRIRILQPRTGHTDNWRLKPALSGGGLFHDLSPHQLDLCLHWFGPVKNTLGFSSCFGTGPAEDYVAGLIQFESGVQIDGLWCFAVDSGEHSADEFVIHGTEGIIRFSFFGESVVLENRDGRQEFDFELPDWLQEPMIEQTVRYFLGDGPCPCPAADGIGTMKIIDAFTSGG